MDEQRQNLLLVLEEVITSSSSSDSEVDIDNIIINNNNNCRCDNRRIPRIENFIENVILRYNDKEFQENFRLRRTTFEYLLFCIRSDLEGNVETFGRMPIIPEKQLYITLYILGTPDSYRSVTTKFNVGKATAWRAVKRVVKAICKLRNYFIRWPSDREAEECCTRIERKYGFPGVIGAVDGTHIRIASPKMESQAYINRKGVHFIQLQVICNDKLEFIHCHAGLPGSVHDMRVFKYSGVQQRCNEQFFPYDTHLLGDSAYTLQKHVMVPFKDNGHLTVEQTHFNRILSGTRMMVERSIGILQARWRFFLDKLPMRRTDLIPFYMLCICVLHNICLKRQDTFENPVVVPDTIDRNLEPLDVDEMSKNEGTIKRERILEMVNQQ